MDYYDYNVVNAGAAPGSYLGMDPAFLVWIPPLDEDGEILPEERDQLYSELKPKEYIDPGSNKESPEEEVLLPKRPNITGEHIVKYSPLHKHTKVHPLVVQSASSSVESLKLNLEKHPTKKENEIKHADIQLHEFPKKKFENLPKVHKHIEKESKFDKSPIDSNILNEIKFADEDDDERRSEECNILDSYQSSNIISSSKD